MRFSDNPLAPLVRVQWYFVDDIDTAPFPQSIISLGRRTCFGSANWDEAKDANYYIDGPGEVSVDPAQRPWRNGQRPRSAQGLDGRHGPCGTDAMWAGDIPFPWPQPPVDVNGTPLCCLPGGPSWVWVIGSAGSGVNGSSLISVVHPDIFSLLATGGVSLTGRLPSLPAGGSSVNGSALLAIGGPSNPLDLSGSGGVDANSSAIISVSRPTIVDLTGSAGTSDNGTSTYHASGPSNPFALSGSGGSNANGSAPQSIVHPTTHSLTGSGGTEVNGSAALAVGGPSNVLTIFGSGGLEVDFGAVLSEVHPVVFSLTGSGGCEASGFAL